MKFRLSTSKTAISLNYWLNTRKGFYDPAKIARIKNPKAFRRYIDECEKKYREFQKTFLDNEEKQAVKALQGLRKDLKEWFENKLFSTLLRMYNNDLKKVAGILKEKQYQDIIDFHEIREQLYTQYEAERRRQQSQRG